MKKNYVMNMNTILDECNCKVCDHIVAKGWPYFEVNNHFEISCTNKLVYNILY
jgi:hypothetical protein